MTSNGQIKSNYMQSNNITIETQKMKINQTVSKLIEIEKEIDLPYCFAGKDGYDYYKIISPEVSIAVFDFPGSKLSIELRSSVTHFLDNTVEINESSFNEAYNKVLYKIQNQNL